MIANIPAVSPISAASNLVASNNINSHQTGDFLSLVDNALQNVSTQQSNANMAEAGYATGLSGATLGKALIASDKATIAWNATVAVRNEVVSAYQSIMNMQF